MRVAVTGASGHLGRAAVAALRDREIDVVCLDRAPAAVPDARSITLDLSDLGQVFHGLAGCDAVLHLGAIPAPTGYPPEEVFRNNILGDFHVFEAAATLGIDRVVHASSVSALGFPFQHRWSEPLYVPVDEDHPLLPQDAYGLSKAAGEEIAAAYCRRGAGSAASLRFSTILSEDAYPGFIGNVHRDPAASARLLWSYVDLRDAATACALALTTAFSGHERLFITADDTASDLPTTTLLARYFPTVPRRMDSPGRWSLLDCTRASSVLGYQPRRSWAEILAQQPGG